MFPRVAGPRRLAGMAFLVFLAWSLILWIFLPYDNPIILFVQFTTSKVLSIFRSPTADERLLLERPGQFPFTDEEVAYIVKTGYGTQGRVPALLEASKSIGVGHKYEEDNILIVGDFATEFDFQGKKLLIHDMVAAVMEHEAVTKLTTNKTERMQKYENMTMAIQQGRKEEAEQYSKAVGWELDALKVCTLLDMVRGEITDRENAVYTKSAAGVEHDAGQEMVHYARRRHIYHTSFSLPISRAPGPI